MQTKRPSPETTYSLN